MTPDLTLRDLNKWAAMETERLRENLAPHATSHPAFVLAQAAKLTEEVGELHAEILGHAGYQRRSKGADFTTERIGAELADVMICVAILASSHGIDLGAAVAGKIEEIEARHRD